MRVLIGTNHLARLSGSETVVFEFAEYFRSLSADVTVFANWTGFPVANRFRKIDIPLVTDPLAFRPLTFDLIYFQHQIAGLFDYTPHADDRSASTFAFGRLSPNGLLESGGWAHEEALGDLVLANSNETARSIAIYGSKLPTQIFHNAAPDGFHRQRRRPLPERPGSILFISNHKDQSLLEAIQVLRGIARVEHLGTSGDRVSPVTPAIIQRFDLVVTIGKSVQYALAGRTPVFVYDRFGGPGYFDPTNFERAADLNFSGRCTPKMRRGTQLADEILKDYHRGRCFAQEIGSSVLNRFRLPPYLDALAEKTPTPNETRRVRLQKLAPLIMRERLMAAYIRKTYRAQQKLARRTQELAKSLAEK